MKSKETEPDTMFAYSYTIANMVSNQSYQIMPALKKIKIETANKINIIYTHVHLLP